MTTMNIDEQKCHTFQLWGSRIFIPVTSGRRCDSTHSASVSGCVPGKKVKCEYSFFGSYLTATSCAEPIQTNYAKPNRPDNITVRYNHQQRCSTELTFRNL